MCARRVADMYLLLARMDVALLLLPSKVQFTGDDVGVWDGSILRVPTAIKAGGERDDRGEGRGGDKGGEGDDDGEEGGGGGGEQLGTFLIHGKDDLRVSLLGGAMGGHDGRTLVVVALDILANHN